jgi:precorrin-6A/cobalt-precorrin-6A reductase
MILLIGGTGETASLAQGLAEAGYRVLVSTATDVPLATGDHPNISRRKGRLDEEEMSALAKKKGVKAIVDAAHPYAVAVHAAAQRTAHRLDIPCLTFQRPEVLSPHRGGRTSRMCEEESGPGVPHESRIQAGSGEGVGQSLTGRPVSAEESGETASLNRVFFAADHLEAAEMAFGVGAPVLLTTGSRNLASYSEASRGTGIPLVVRVLDVPESWEACRLSGIPEERIIAGRGPFSAEDNLAAIRRFRIGVLVTKESGRLGGIEEKLIAAHLSGCRVIVIRRPDLPDTCPAFDDPEKLIAALKATVAL